MLELLLLWFAFSVRTPNIENNPFDYEFSTGYETKISFIKSDCKLLFERENGRKYSGRIHNHDLKYLIIGEYVKTAKNISSQKIVIKYPKRLYQSTLNLGLTSLWTDYVDNIITGYVGLKTPCMEFELIGLEKVEIFKIKAKYTYNITDNIFIEPNANTYYKNNKWDYFGKVKIGYKWKK